MTQQLQYLISILTEGAIFGIMALGLNIIWGWSGDFDLAYYGYVALGAYMTLVLTIGQPTPPAQYILGCRTWSPCLEPWFPRPSWDSSSA